MLSASELNHGSLIWTEKKVGHKTLCPFRGHFAPRLFLLRFSFFDRNLRARIRMSFKAPHSPVSVKLFINLSSTSDSTNFDSLKGRTTERVYLHAVLPDQQDSGSYAQEQTGSILFIRGALGG